MAAVTCMTNFTFLQNVKRVSPETRSDSKVKLMSSRSSDPFFNVKQEDISAEPFSFVSVKLRTDDEC
jgi:hypothetical protein